MMIAKVAPREKLSLWEFLEMAVSDSMFASTFYKDTQTYGILAEDENGVIREYTHPACDEAPVEDYMEFMIALRVARKERERRLDEEYKVCGDSHADLSRDGQMQEVLVAAAGLPGDP